MRSFVNYLCGSGPFPIAFLQLTGWFADVQWQGKHIFLMFSGVSTVCLLAVALAYWPGRHIKQAEKKESPVRILP
jgi:hypothetical protein